jgi:hypothetical protein
MTPEEERELFARLARIERRLGMIGALLIGAVAAHVASRFYPDARDKYGELIALLIEILILFGLVWYFARKLAAGDRSGRADSRRAKAFVSWWGLSSVSPICCS